MCLPPAINLPVHDTIKVLLVQVPHHNTQNAIKKNMLPLRYHLALPKRRQTTFHYRPSGKNLSPLGAKLNQTYYSSLCRLTVHSSLPSASRSRDAPGTPIAWRPLPRHQTLYQ
ncbi:hypothetical protein DEO72_LG10g2349 [Vigna unguiculata]|uniref:Uncharacterized protein n=1 Tax=Vigna unguiculata TaxID=3917 RepID=A0A4D6NBQ5_VIGUN|nr:hypothetical protein DEO72_LG10g2349 [Vigna unguiculata]